MEHKQYHFCDPRPQSMISFYPKTHLLSILKRTALSSA
nr:MAG TPA: hypothetical protein [Caudoviricetes sp.]